MPFGNQRIGFNNPPLPLTGFQQIINKNGYFIYSGVPASGNLVFSIAAVAGTDKFGNSYLAGATSYSASGVISENGGVLLIYAPTAAAGNLIASVAPAAGNDSFGNAYRKGMATYGTGGSYLDFLNNVISVGANAGDVRPALLQGGGGDLLVQSGAANSLDGVMGLTMLSTALSVSGNNPQMCLAGGTPNPVTGALLEVQGQAVITLLSALAASDTPGVHPGTVNTPETWQSMNTRGYQNGWTDTGHDPPGRWRLVPSPQKWVQVQGSLNTPATPPDGQVILNLPAVYHPPTDRLSFSGRLVCPSNATVQARINVLSTGNVTISGASALAASTELVIPGGSGFSLD